MKKHWKTYAFWILLAEAVGGLAAFLTREGTEVYNATAAKPPLSPPEWVFPVVWGILYALMGIGAARVALTEENRERSRGLNLFVVQLAANFLWSIVFFNFQAYGFAFTWLLLLFALVAWMTLTFAKTDRLAALLQIPYLIWLGFAAYLNAGVYLLN